MITKFTILLFVLSLGSCQSFVTGIPLSSYFNSNDTLRNFQEQIKKEFLHAYKSYEKCCFGSDEIRPLTYDGRNCFHEVGSPDYGLGITIIDSLDTLILFNLTEEYETAREFVKNLNFEKPNIFISFFETVIRVLGGLLSAYELSRDELFLNKAKKVC